MKNTAKLSLEKLLASSGATVPVLESNTESPVKLLRQASAPGRPFESKGPAGLYALLLPVRPAGS
jgi:hypothetical protein